MRTEPIIIIADETLSVQAQLGETLGQGISLVSAMNQEQLEYWLHEPERQPDVLLLDHAFVGQQLQRFCHQWTHDPATRDISLVVMGPDDEELETGALSAGASEYLRKPLSSPLCRVRIGRILDTREEIRRLEALCVTDGLTQIANRRYFDDFLTAEWRRAIREEGNIGLIMVDIDHFKGFNDHYGHPEGDKCLKRVAQCLKEQAQRPRDMVARYGGEEFAIVLPSIHFEGMKVVAERIRDALAAMAIPNAASDTDPRVTVSMGLAWAEPNAKDKVTTLIEAADEALYAAKSGGRNRFSETVDLASVRSLIAN
ncbi:diguanylate cyclase domain-containing protein [Thalassolituus sp.]|jgi:diguanylate cyclase (GGDEF)-like protein|uniref:GGDEF domain-containing response regulator n=1 Tax=Thalassolituus sp. TaxID=2030822 RepID=UPI002628F6C4|nr:diguanylate cyclase [uncultured Thalassolituus sp.]TNC92406.1 MAG: diguanylate cyclase response regulator [Thalassolituus sp.]